jgi:WD40 repeat protein
MLAMGSPEVVDPEKGFLLTAHSPDRTRLLLLSLDGGMAKVDAVTAGGVRTVSRWSAPGAYCAAFSADGSEVIVNASGMGSDAPSQRLRVYRCADGSVVRELDAPVSCDAVWSADGTTVLTSNGSHRSVFWDARTWRPRSELTGDLGGNITTFGLSPDGTYAVIQEPKALHLVSTRDAAVIATIPVLENAQIACCIRFSPDGRRFAVLWHDGRVDLFEPEVLRAELAKFGLAW